MFDELDFEFFFGFGRGRKSDTDFAFPSQTRRSGAVGERRGQFREAFAPTVPEPIPIPPPVRRIPIGTPPIFPETVSVGTRRIGARVLGPLGALIITGAEILVRVLEKKQLSEMGEILREQAKEIFDINKEAIRRKIEARAELEVEKRVRELLGAPETFEIGDPLPTPEPLPEPAPQRVPVEIPDIAVPGTLPLPAPATVPAPTVPKVSPTTRPSPATIPQPFPGVFDPVPFPLPRTPTPIFLPQRVPLLTPTQPVSVSSLPGRILEQVNRTFLEPVLTPETQLATALSPLTSSPTDTCAPTRCQDEVDEDEPRLRCFKGLYREGRTFTDFTQWAEVDCETGREI